MAVYQINYYAYFIILLFVPFIICTPDMLVGELTPIEVHPYMASVQHWTLPEKMIKLQCAGVIIASRSVLTVASCYKYRERYDHLYWIVRVGSSIANFKGDVYGVDSFITYDDGNDEEHTRLHDIALVITDVPINYSSTVQPIPISLTSAPINHNVTLTGWTYWSMMRDQHQLRSLHLTTSNKEDCLTTHTDVLCAGVHSDKHGYVCYGDAGAPVVTTLKAGASLVGILLWGGGCDLTLYPVSFLDVPYYSSWISKVVVNE